MDIHAVSRLEKLLQTLNTPVSILDLDGNSIIPNQDICITLPPLKPEGVCSEGRTYKVCQSLPELVMMVSSTDTQAVEDLFCLVDTTLGAVVAANTATNDVGNAFQKLLLNELSQTEIDAVIAEHEIEENMSRCVLLLHIAQLKQQNAYTALESVFPRIVGDVIVSMDKHTVAVIKNSTHVEEDEELYEFALALQETLMNETALALTVGVGEVVPSANDLHFSYRQARRSIEIGRLFKPDQTVYVYRQLLLERFLSDLPSEMARHYHSLLFNRETARVFSDDMLYTIEMFLKKDLNLSDTARQLYIHRNTLVYRLDKIQRLVGLDLRKFDDAMTFKMLLEMKKCTSNKQAKKQI